MYLCLCSVALLDLWRSNKTLQNRLVERLLQANGQLKNPADCELVWTMTPAQRAKILAQWAQDKDSDTIEDYAQRITDLHAEQAKLQGVKQMRDKIALEGRRVIGVTTSGAAKYHGLLEHVRAGVLIVEEAGEVLEQHVLTALSSDPKHLIMIGDHQQLRPKIDTYELQVGHRNGFDLNRSMFERLVLAKFPFKTLHNQHCMHRSIAHLVHSMTYPELRTAATVTEASHPKPLGLIHRLSFVHHPHPEDSYAQLAQRADGDGSTTSKINTREAEMVVRTALFLRQQGYQSSSIVILTPYLGQCSLIRTQLRKLRFDAELSEMDLLELQKAEEMAKLTQPAATQKEHSPPPSAVVQDRFRTATIDNFQGQEGEIILVSMVRSNPQGQIGFSGDKERVNVLLSRARIAMVIFGNKDTLCKPRQSQWTHVFNVKFASGATALPVFTGLHIQCERHPEERHEIREPAEFDKLVPEGGCKRTCGAAMECRLQGHHCTRPCHLVTGDCHSARHCHVKRQVLCPTKKHMLTLACHLSTPEAIARSGCVKCRQEAEAAERERQAALIRQQQLEQEMAKLEMDFKLDVERMKREAEAKQQAELLAVAKTHNEQAKAVIKAEPAKQQQLSIAAMTKQYSAYMEQLEAQLKHVPLLAAQVGPMPPPFAAASSSPAALPKDLLTPLPSASPAFNAVKLEFFESAAKMPAWTDWTFKVVGVEQVHNPKLSTAYEQAKAVRKAAGFPEEMTLYHGTRPNIESIVRHNLSMAKKGQLDPGWLGAGLYFSEHADYTLMYSTWPSKHLQAKQRIKILRFAALPGRIQQLTSLQNGQPKHPQYDSNRSTNGFEIILFDAQFCLPKFVIEIELQQAPGAKFNGSHEQKGQ